jgi:hypothetical protein
MFITPLSEIVAGYRLTARQWPAALPLGKQLMVLLQTGVRG